MRSSEAACLANSAVFVRSGASRTDVVSRIRLVTAAAAASAISSLTGRLGRGSRSRSHGYDRPGQAT